MPTNKFTYSMKYSNEKIAGLLYFCAATQFVLALVIAEALYPGYSISNNYISDLGIGPSSIVFNSSIFLLGVLSLIGTYCLYQVSRNKIFTILLMISSAATMGVGVFTEHFLIIHYVVSVLAFLFGGISAIYSYKMVKRPFSILGVLLGIFSLTAMILFLGDMTLGLGVGGMERLIVYPILLWFVGFGVFLITNSEKN